MNWTWIYIGALYAAAVWLARWRGIDIPRRVAVFFYALVLVFFFKPLTQDYVNTQDDFLKTLPPWAFTTNDPSAINKEMNDIPLQHVVWGIQVRESWKRLEPPLWNSFNGSGYPLLANGQSSALSPIRLLALPVPTRHFMAAEAAMKILIALTFTFLFCRGRRYGELASVIGAIVFAFAGFLHSWLHFPHVTTACFLPAALWLVDRTAEQRTFGRFVAAAVLWTAILFGGHPETASHIFLLSLLYVAWIVFVEKRTNWRLFLSLGGAMAVAALLSSPFLLPFLEALPKSQRYQALKAMPLEAAGLPYTDLQCMIVLFQAHFFGRVPFEEAWGPAVAEPVGGFSGVLGIASFFGLIFWIVRGAARRRRSSDDLSGSSPWRSPELFFVLATILVFGVINGWPFIGKAIHAVLPVVAHARFRLLFVMLMGIQAAAVVDLTVRGDRKPLLSGCAVVAAMLALLLVSAHYPSDAYRLTSFLTSLRSIAVLVLAALLALLSRWRKPALLGLMVAVIFELWSVTRGWNPSFPADMMYPRTPLIRTLQTLKANNTPDTWRVAGIGGMVFPNINAVFGVEDIRAHDPMSYDRYMGFLRLTTGYQTENYHPWFENQDTSVLDYLNVKYLVQDPLYRAADPERYALVYSGRDGKIYENRHMLPRFFAVRNVVIDFNDDSFFRRLTAHTDWANTGLLDKLDLESQQMHDDFFKPRPPNAPLAVARVLESHPTSYRVHVSAPRWSLVVSSVPWWPGWKVERNGRSVKPIRVNGAFLGFAVPPGETNVRVYYSPWTWWVGMGFFGFAVVGLAAWALTRNRKLSGQWPQQHVS